MNYPLSGGSNNACDASYIDGRCSSTAAQYCNTFGKMDNRRSSCSSCAGNSYIPGIRNSHIPGIRSRNDIRDNRSRFRLLRCRLKPERQLVLPESKPVRLLSMEVKEVFSLFSLLLDFPFFQEDDTPVRELIDAFRPRPSL